jgi:hypothetical protein
VRVEVLVRVKVREVVGGMGVPVKVMLGVRVAVGVGVIVLRSSLALAKTYPKQ